MSNIPSEQELMDMCEQAARKAIEATISKYVPAWNPASIDSLVEAEDKKLVARVLWLVNCFDAMGITHAARYVYGYASERTINRIERKLTLYPRPYVNRWRSGAFYVLRSDVSRLCDTIQDQSYTYSLTSDAAK